MSPENLSLAYVERKHILAVLHLCHENRTRAAKILGISVRCLRNKIREYRDAGTVVPEGTSGPSREVAEGLGCGAGLSMLLPQGPIAIGAGVLIAMLLCELLNLREGAKVAGFICGIVMLQYSNDPWWYAWLRSIETMLGIAVAWALSYVPKFLGDKT